MQTALIVSPDKGFTAELKLLLRGVTMAGTAATLGSLLATSLGGMLIDAIGVRSALAAVQLFPACGTVLLTIALLHAIRHPHRQER